MLVPAIDLEQDLVHKALDKRQDILEQIIILIMILNHLKFNKLQMLEISFVILLI